MTVGKWITVSEIEHVGHLLPEAETSRLMFVSSYDGLLVDLQKLTEVFEASSGF